jgi:hypothetical protein
MQHQGLGALGNPYILVARRHLLAAPLAVASQRGSDRRCTLSAKSFLDGRGKVSKKEGLKGQDVV